MSLEHLSKQNYFFQLFLFHYEHNYLSDPKKKSHKRGCILENEVKAKVLTDYSVLLILYDSLRKRSVIIGTSLHLLCTHLFSTAISNTYTYG